MQRPDPQAQTAVKEAATPAVKDGRWDKFKKPAKSKEAAPTQAPDDQLDGVYDDTMLAAIKLREPVVVDVSVDRALLRKQVEGLKERGYRYDSIQKLWIVN